METLVIKNNLLSGGTEKLYRDAVVTNGSLFCFDFSNKGCVLNDDLSTVRDLALESKNDLGIPNLVSFSTANDVPVPDLTELKGFPLVNLGSTNTNNVDTGLNIFGVDDYLANEQPEKTVFIFWIGIQDAGFSSGQMIILASGDSATQVETNNFRIQPSDITVSARHASISFANQSRPLGVSAQYAIERVGLGQPNRHYINGIYIGDSSNNAEEFNPAVSNRPISVGLKSTGANSNHVLYRFLSEDLDVSGRSAIDVIQKDYSYVNALGEFSGIEKRPFANV